MKALALTACLLATCTPAYAETCTAWTEQGPQVTGPLLADRAYLPGLELTADLALYCGEDPEEPAWFSMCLQLSSGVVCKGVQL